MAVTGGAETGAVALVGLVALAPLVWCGLAKWSPVVRAVGLAVWCGGYLLVCSAYHGGLEEKTEAAESAAVRAAETRPVVVRSDGYVGSETCQSCHPHYHETWYDSYHRTMTQVAGHESVMGDFDDRVLELDGAHYRLTRDEEGYYVDLPDEVEDDLGTGRRKIVMTTGSHHMQVYWFDSGKGREVGQLPFVYLLDERRWIPRASAFLRDPKIPRFDEHGRWNKTCLKCHVTRGIWAPEGGESDRPQTQVAEFGISCEACHGPGEEHVALNRNPARRYQLHVAGGGDPTMVQPEDLALDVSSEVCGQCHSTAEPNSPESFLTWKEKGVLYRPGDDLDDTRFVIRRLQSRRPEMIQSLIRDDPFYLNDYFWTDGMVRVSGREYTAMLEAPCHQEGQMSCMSCHQLHQSPGDPRNRKEWANDQLDHTVLGNASCLQCHEQFKDEASIVAHTHHAAGSVGSECMNCHMPHTTYGLLKGIRSHTIDSPSVFNTLATGRPNACNLCHLDRTLGWTAERLGDWYGQRVPATGGDYESTAASLVWLLKGDAGQRALVAWHAGWEGAKAGSRDNAWMVPSLARLLDDPYDAVRFIAHRSLRGLPGVPEEVADGYDFVGSENARAEAVKAVEAGWLQWAAERGEAWGPGLLIGGDGSIEHEAIDRLQEERNDIRMYLAE